MGGAKIIDAIALAAKLLCDFDEQIRLNHFDYLLQPAP